MSFKTAFTKLNKVNVIEVATNHVAYVHDVMDTFNQALVAISSETENAVNVATLRTAITAMFPSDLLDTWMHECDALIKNKTTPSVASLSTDTTSTTVLTTTPHPDDDEIGFRRPHSYKLPPNVPMFTADGHTCEECFFVFKNALHANSIPPTVILSILSTFLKGTAFINPFHIGFE